AWVRPEGQSKALKTVFAAIHEGNPDAELLAYQYLQTLPLIAQGEANKVWIIPSDLQQAIGRVAGAVKDLAPGPSQVTDGQKPEEALGRFDRTPAGRRGTAAPSER